MSMATWQESLLTKITPEHRRFQLAHDPDGLLLDENTLSILVGRGFAVLRYENEISFRLEFETRFRARWDDGQEAESTAVLVIYAEETLDDLPWDIAHAAFVHKLSLREWFPDLDVSVVREVPAAKLGRLFERYQNQRPGPLGANATADFILVGVFKIADALIETEAELLRLLLDLHFRRVELPLRLVDRLVFLLSPRPAFRQWPLKALFADYPTFIAFVEERWRVAVESLLHGADGHTLGEAPAAPYLMQVAGPVRLPFDDDAVRVVLDNFFLEGVLLRASVQVDVSSLPAWVRMGVTTDDGVALGEQFERLLKLTQAKLPAEDGRHGDWVQLAWAFAELLRTWHQLPMSLQPTFEERLKQLRDALDTRFAAWLNGRYGSLATLPAVSSPVMGHHVAPFLARKRSSGAGNRVALIVMDGMAMDQWLLLQHAMEQERMPLDYVRGGVFAWLPTLTSIARQAIFAGAIPRNLKNITTTQGEESAWQQFWGGHGVPAPAVGYIKGLRRADQLPDVAEFTSNGQVQVLGIIVDAIDTIMHGMTLGSRGLHTQVTTWNETGMLGKLLMLLLDAGFEVFVTADHGNIEASGVGRIAQGVLAETKGERVRIYGEESLFQKTASDFPAIAEPGARVGLPDDTFPLYAKGRGAFIPVGETVVGHGGACVEELIVPFVQVRRKSEAS